MEEQPGDKHEISEEVQAGTCPANPHLAGHCDSKPSGDKGHNMNDITMPGSPALWAGSFTSLRA
jgi:hypothetical protein